MAAILKGTTVKRSGDGVDVYLRALLSGELGFADYYAISALRGRVFTAASANVTTPTTFEATATIDVTKSLFMAIVGSGVAIIPMNIEVYYEAFGSNAQMELQALIGTGGSRTSGMTAVTPVCTRSDLAPGSGVTVWMGGNSTVTVGPTSKINYFWRTGQQFAITKTTASATAAVSDPNRLTWSALAESSFNIAGPESQLVLNQGSQAGTGFVKIQWIEIPASELPS